MRVYIASKYIEHEEINRHIYNALAKEGIDVFLPKSINIDATTDEEMFYVGEQCYNELEKCDIVLVVEPYGLSVSSEIGYAICQKRNAAKTIILFSCKDCIMSKREAMITPYFDVTVNSIKELVKYVKERSNQ